MERPSSLNGTQGPQFLAKYRGSVDLRADSAMEPVSVWRHAPYWGDMPWTIAHKMTLIRGKMVLAAPSNVTKDSDSFSYFFVTARAS